VRPEEVAVRCGSDGIWVTREATGIRKVPTTRVQKHLYPGEPLRFRRGLDGEEVALSPRAVFRQGVRLFFGYNMTDRAIAVSEERSSDGSDEIEVVVLTWKTSTK
jgi:hypothetical protein